VQFVGFAANAVCEEERITLRPGDSAAGILKASSGTWHDDDVFKKTRYFKMFVDGLIESCDGTLEVFNACFSRLFSAWVYFIATALRISQWAEVILLLPLCTVALPNINCNIFDSIH
jgi:hypothetical protein